MKNSLPNKRKNSLISHAEKNQRHSPGPGLFENLKKLFYRTFLKERIILCIKGFRYRGHLIWRIEDARKMCDIELCNIQVVPKERGKGYGTEMVQKLEEIAKRKGQRCIYVFTGRDSRAKEFYKKNGFQEIPILKKYFQYNTMLVKKIIY